MEAWVLDACAFSACDFVAVALDSGFLGAGVLDAALLDPAFLDVDVLAAWGFAVVLSGAACAPIISASDPTVAINTFHRHADARANVITAFLRSNHPDMPVGEIVSDFENRTSNVLSISCLQQKPGDFAAAGGSSNALCPFSVPPRSRWRCFRWTAQAYEFIVVCGVTGIFIDRWSEVRERNLVTEPGTNVVLTIWASPFVAAADQLESR